MSSTTPPPTTKPRRTSRAARAADKAAETVTPITAARSSQTTTGRQASGDRRPAPKPTAPAPAPATTEPKPKAKATALGPTGYRIKHGKGTTDATIVKGVREAFKDDESFKLSDEQILAASGWALTTATALKKVRASLAAS